jgi:23S rRNA (uracil1939-C5)-methyltransferase
MPAELEQVRIDKLVHGGQAIGTLSDGRKVFVWNALPGELLGIRLIKNKRSYAEAIAEEIVESSPERLTPEEDNYLATSPWQMMSFDAENRYKQAIVEELFSHEKVKLPALKPVVHDDRLFEYRNKMEYSFWGDDDGLHLALHIRGSHGKQIVTGSRLAMPAIDAAANAVVTQLSKLGARAGDLKTIIVRCNQAGETVAALFTKLDKFTRLELPPELTGLRVYHSNPKSPASVPTRLLYELGDCGLADTLLGPEFCYDVDSFFQVNLPVYEVALGAIKEAVQGDDIVDMYAGAGTIGLSVASKSVELVELDAATVNMARKNAKNTALQATVTEADSANTIQSIVLDKAVIFDPPRAGLHAKVVQRVLEVLPPQVIYLSCNPATHARDLKLLQEKYDITQFEIYNFFPRTPHIETLAVLKLK